MNSFVRKRANAPTRIYFEVGGKLRGEKFSQHLHAVLNLNVLLFSAALGTFLWFRDCSLCIEKCFCGTKRKTALFASLEYYHVLRGPDFSRVFHSRKGLIGRWNLQWIAEMKRLRNIIRRWKRLELIRWELIV